MLSKQLCEFFWLANLLGTASSQYILIDDFQPSNFLEGFNFFTDRDPTNGFVQYVNSSYARDNAMVRTFNDHVYIGVDILNRYPVTGIPGITTGRPSIRLESKHSYTRGLFILNLKHIPYGCGTWPAFWTYGPAWPSNGEIDVIEGVNINARNQVTLHTAKNCSTAGSKQSGVLRNADCFAKNGMLPGCGVQSHLDSSYGRGFNDAGGGIYAMEWTSDSIKVWQWAAGEEPEGVTDGKPDVSKFGNPMANFQGDCSIDDHFANHSLAFDISFCGDYAGGAYSSSSCPMINGEDGAESCVAYVAQNPSAFTEAYWSIKSLRVFQEKDGLSTSSRPKHSTSLSSVSPVPLPLTFKAGKGATTTSFKDSSATVVVQTWDIAQSGFEPLENSPALSILSSAYSSQESVYMVSTVSDTDLVPDTLIDMATEDLSKDVAAAFSITNGTYAVSSSVNLISNVVTDDATLSTVTAFVQGIGAPAASITVPGDAAFSTSIGLESHFGFTEAMLLNDSIYISADGIASSIMTESAISGSPISFSNITNTEPFTESDDDSDSETDAGATAEAITQTAAAAAAIVTSAGSYVYQNCSLDNANTGQPTFGDGPINYNIYGVEDCANWCYSGGASAQDDAYIVFGVEGGSNCVCANSVIDQGSSDKCTQPCLNNPTEICGGDGAVNVYLLRDFAASTPISTPYSSLSGGAISISSASGYVNYTIMSMSSVVTSEPLTDQVNSISLSIESETSSQTTPMSTVSSDALTDATTAEPTYIPLPTATDEPRCGSYFIDSTGAMSRIYCNATIKAPDLYNGYLRDFKSCIEMCDDANTLGGQGSCIAAQFSNDTETSSGTCVLKAGGAASISIQPLPSPTERSFHIPSMTWIGGGPGPVVSGFPTLTGTSDVLQTTLESNAPSLTISNDNTLESASSVYSYNLMASTSDPIYTADAYSSANSSGPADFENSDNSGDIDSSGDSGGLEDNGDPGSSGESGSSGDSSGSEYSGGPGDPGSIDGSGDNSDGNSPEYSDGSSGSSSASDKSPKVMLTIRLESSDALRVRRRLKRPIKQTPNDLELQFEPSTYVAYMMQSPDQPTPEDPMNNSNVSATTALSQPSPVQASALGASSRTTEAITSPLSKSTGGSLRAITITSTVATSDCKTDHLGVLTRMVTITVTRNCDSAAHFHSNS